MQLAILCVLVLIAIILAPWLVGLVVAAAVGATAAYGVYLVALGAILAVVLVAATIWALITFGSREQEAPPIAGERAQCPFCQAETPARKPFCDNCQSRL